MRIIGGLAKGRRLTSPKGGGTRPMTDRVREAIFNILDVTDADVLDLFAGTGSIGLEALSRGAATCRFVEQDRKMAEILRGNIEAVGLGGTVSEASVERFLAGRPQPTDLVFCDPPYPMPLEEVEAILSLLDDWLAPGGWVILHRPAGEEAPNAPWDLDDARTYGGTHLWWYRKEDA
ncbi:MAG: 16S rRNA (guanine(966)-N(2))-methyltransferase RsmD [Acidimicrobiia bacterium]|nr:MAG: 16S rRNA (guanine(966)-N(2))-methyltransferase RsmD [Acidimicrobiia bacterium]